MQKHDIVNEIEQGYSVQSGVFSAINSKITTKLNEYGQYEAQIDFDTMTARELDDLAAISAMSNHTLNESALGMRLFGKVAGVKHDSLLGYYTSLYAGYVAADDYRANASSGGIASWLLVRLLEKKLIDGVIHVAPVDPEKNDGVLFKYVISKTPDAIRGGAKSRYYPTDLSEVLKLAKRSGGKYAVTGIPSFITEVRLLAEHDPAFKKSIAYTIGLVCGHQKSTKYAEALAWQYGIKPGDLKSVDFRKKVDGQPANRYISEFQGIVDGNLVTITKDQDELFASDWGQSMFKSKLSDFTDDAFNEAADISLGDAWLPEYTKDSRGTNVVIVRNKKISEILKEGIKSGALVLDILSPEKIIQSQSGLARHNREEIAYRLAKQDSSHIWRPTKRVNASNDIPLLRKLIQDAREDIYTKSHEYYKTAVELDDWNYFYTNMKPLVARYRNIYRVVAVQKTAKKGPTHLAKKVSGKLLRKVKK